MLRSKRCLARLITAFLPSTPASGQCHPVCVMTGKDVVVVFISTATSSITYAGVSSTATWESKDRERQGETGRDTERNKGEKEGKKWRNGEAEMERKSGWKCRY